MEIVLSVGSAAYVIDLEGSISGGNWTVIGTISSSADPDMVHVVDKAVKFIRYNITTVGGGNTISVYLIAVR